MHKVYVPFVLSLCGPAGEIRAVLRFLIPSVFVVSIFPTAHFLLFAFTSLVSVSRLQFCTLSWKVPLQCEVLTVEKSEFLNTSVIMNSYFVYLEQLWKLLLHAIRSLKLIFFSPFNFYLLFISNVRRWWSVPVDICGRSKVFPSLE